MILDCSVPSLCVCVCVIMKKEGMSLRGSSREDMGRDKLDSECYQNKNKQRNKGYETEKYQCIRDSLGKSD